MIGFSVIKNIIKQLCVLINILILSGCNLPDNNLVLPTVISSTETPKELINPQNNVFGITMYSFDDVGGLTQAAQAGTAWTRGEFVWQTIEPAEGNRFWDSNLEQGLINANSQGITPIMLIEGTPNWALKQNFECGAVAAEKFPALAKFAYDLVQRYSTPPYNVRYWELWNEPDVAGTLGCWGDPSDTQYYGGAYYGEMLKAVYPQIKSADPRAQVLVGGLLLDCDLNHPPAEKDCLPARFLEGILESGAGPDFDGVSFHAYDFYTGEGTYGNPNWNSSSGTTGPVSIAKANYLEALLARYGYTGKYLVNTETALFWGPNVMDPPCGPAAPPDIEAMKVNYVVESYAAAVAVGLKANIWYSMFGVRCSGLLNLDLQPIPAYYAYQFAEQKLGKALFIRPVSEFPGIMGYEFELPGRKLWVLWSKTGLESQINLTEPPLEVSLIGENGKVITEHATNILTVDFHTRIIEFPK